MLRKKRFHGVELHRHRGRQLLGFLPDRVRDQQRIVRRAYDQAERIVIVLVLWYGM